MKTKISFLTFFLIIGYKGWSSETVREISAILTEVTVFPGNAQVVSQAEITLNSGTSTLILNNLSPYIDNQSVQVKAPSGIKIMSVQHKLDYLTQDGKSEQVSRLFAQMTDLKTKMEDENTAIGIMNEKLDFLRDNRSIAGKGPAISADHLKSLTDYYASTVEVVQLEILKRKRKVKDYETELSKYNSQLNTLNYSEQKKNGQIIIILSSAVTKTIKLTISYLVSNAGWRPSYDLRADRIDLPLKMICKATVYQNTGTDWKNVKLRFSNADPSKSGTAPVLMPWRLSFGRSLPSSASTAVQFSGPLQTRNVKGVVKDENNEPMPGVNVVIKGSSTGTVTDLNGQFSLDVPVNSGSLLFSFVGYAAEELYPSYNLMNITLVPDVTKLDEIVVIGYGTQKKSDLTGSVSSVRSEDLQGRISGVNIRGTTSGRAIYGSRSSQEPAFVPLPDIKTTVEFEIQDPQSIPTGGNEFSVEIKSVEIPVQFEYFAVPKIDPGVFLIARMAGWEKYSLLSGETNLYFENTYIGKSYLDLNTLTDTLNISLGRDKSLLVSREKQRDYTAKQILGNNRIETRNIGISLRNTKAQPVHINVIDQVPVSSVQEIEVKHQEISDAIINEETGELKWKMDLKPSETKKLQIKYEVRFPKYQTVMIE